MNNLDEERTIAFNQGCDARLAGLPLSMNPYRGSARTNWRLGWLDVDRHWAEWVEGRWRVYLLPDVPILNGRR